MNKLLVLGAAALISLGISAASHANEAQVVCHCFSVVLQPAQIKLVGQTYTLSATTLTDGTINNEIGISDDLMGSGYLHSTYLLYTDPIFPDEPIPFYCELTVPDPGESNLNGVFDFFEVDVAVTGAKSEGEVYWGESIDPVGTLDMTWDRAAGSCKGVCKLRLRVLDFSVDMTFEHTFEILDYRGTLNYEVDGEDILGTVALSRQGTEGSMAGPFNLHRVDPFELTYDSAAWTNEKGATTRWYSSFAPYLRLYMGALGTNYYATIATADGMPDTPETGEYMIYEIHIFDANDADGDGFADIADEPPPPKPPGLLIRQEGKTLKLQITAKAGRTVYIEQAATLPFKECTTLPSIVLTSDVHEIELTSPASSPTFWRARVE